MRFGRRRAIGAALPDAELTAAQLERYDDGMLVDLETAAVEEKSDRAIEHALKQGQVDDADQARRQRETIIRWVLVATTGTLVAGACVILAYVISEWHDLDPIVLSAWFTASVVQTVGLVLVITRSLFPATAPHS